MSYYRILTMDGGGIRGLLTAIILERLERVHPGFLAQVDLFAGTSTGGLLALGLAAGKTPAECRRIFETQGAKAFKDSLWDNIHDLGNLIGAQYSLGPLKEELEVEFHSLTLVDLPKRVLVSSFDLDNHLRDATQYRTWKPKFFHNFPGRDSDGDQRVVDVAIYTAAAPTYFPTYHGYIDGGVVAGNPSVCALAQALEPLTGGQKLEDVILLSVSTGHNPHYLEVQDADWGLAQWAPHLVTLVMEGSAGLADYQCRQFLGQRYLRLDPLLSAPIEMDEISRIPDLQQIAMQTNLDEAVDWLNRYFV